MQVTDVPELMTIGTLQDELPPQSEMRMGGKRGFQPYMPVATMIAASMQPPPSVEVCGFFPPLLCSISHNWLG